MRKLSLVLIAILLLPFAFTFTSCKKNETLTLNVYNWEEYIAEDDYDAISEFENYYFEKHQKKVKVNYSTFGTNENMYNELKLTQNNDGTYDYDLVCPSDYMIQRMIEEDMLDKYDYNNGYTNIPNYNEYTSPYIQKLFTDNNWQEYATCYMWGTMGYTYNPEFVSDEDMKTWKGILNPDYKYKSTIKDSVRDSYVLAMGIAYEKELNDYKGKPNYNQNLINLFNTVNSETVSRVDPVLRELKQNIYGFEVDSGKNDMASGKLWINFAWSGDSVYVLDIAEEAGTELKYSVPEEGSNIFFDGWVMPKGANKALAQEFLDFMYSPECAVENMNYIGYTPSTAGDALFENAIDWYGLYTLIEVEEETEDSVLLDGKYYEEYYFGDLDEQTLSSISNSGETYNIIYPIYDDEENIIAYEECEGVEVFAKDITYFFENISEDYKTDGRAIIYTDTQDRQFDTQYPSEEIVNRCAIMKHLPADQNEMLNNMWASVKIGYMKPIYMVLTVLGIALVVVVAVVFFKLIESGKFGYGKTRKNMTLVTKEEKK